MHRYFYLSWNHAELIRTSTGFGITTERGRRFHNTDALPNKLSDGAAHVRFVSTSGSEYGGG